MTDFVELDQVSRKVTLNVSEIDAIQPSGNNPDWTTVMLRSGKEFFVRGTYNEIVTLIKRNTLS